MDLQFSSHDPVIGPLHTHPMRQPSSPPRVLMLSDVYFPRVNGVSTSIQTFRSDLRSLGCHSLLVAPEYPQPRIDEPGIVRVGSRYLPFDPEDRLMRLRELERACASLEGQFDLIHIQTPFLAHRAGVRLARRLGLGSIETYHTYFEHYFHHYLPLLPQWALRRAARTISRRQCNAVDAIVAPSQPMAEALREYGVSTPIHVIPTGLDLRTFSGGERNRFRAALGIEAARPVMLTVGRVAFEKNIEFIIDVLADVRRTCADVLLVIAGEGPALPMLERRVVELGLAQHVRFVGYLDRGSELLDCYRAADVFVFASKTETQGLVVLEAMCLGVPVVSTAVMGTKAVLANARGALVIAEDDCAQFASAVVSVLTNAERRAVLGAEARAFVVSHWSSAEMARRMRTLYVQVRDARADKPRLNSAGLT
jgi:1,2-diacylglycerol 3-alpha-glucosyltransferase